MLRKHFHSPAKAQNHDHLRSQRGLVRENKKKSLNEINEWNGRARKGKKLRGACEITTFFATKVQM